jgi:hypothetical protein
MYMKPIQAVTHNDVQEPFLFAALLLASVLSIEFVLSGIIILIVSLVLYHYFFVALALSPLLLIEVTVEENLICGVRIFSTRSNLKK